MSTIAAELKKIVAESVPSDELEKARSFAKGRFVLQLESPQGLIMYGLNREVHVRVAGHHDQVERSIPGDRGNVTEDPLDVRARPGHIEHRVGGVEPAQPPGMTGLPSQA